MDNVNISELLSQVQTGARITTAVGEPVPVGERLVIPVAEVAYGGGGGMGKGMSPAEEKAEGSGVGGGMGVRIRPLGCWIIGPNDERWLPAVDVNRLVIIGGIGLLMMSILRIIGKRRRL